MEDEAVFVVVGVGVVGVGVRLREVLFLGANVGFGCLSLLLLLLPLLAFIKMFSRVKEDIVLLMILSGKEAGSCYSVFYVVAVCLLFGLSVRENSLLSPAGFNVPFAV